MTRSIELARLSVEHGNHPFGALITANGELFVEAENVVVTDFDPSGHAEIAAIRKACRERGSLELKDCTLYTSCEPCWMCSAAIRRTGIQRVVFALDSASRGGGVTTEYPILTNSNISGFGPPPEVVRGFMVAESQQLWNDVGWPNH
jgi:tRNA(Arg) A34 adenosine deaminase TadA